METIIGVIAGSTIGLAIIHFMTRASKKPVRQVLAESRNIITSEPVSRPKPPYRPARPATPTKRVTAPTQKTRRAPVSVSRKDRGSYDGGASYTASSGFYSSSSDCGSSSDGGGGGCD